MQKRTLGRNGLEVSALGFGCMGISQSYGRPSTREDGSAIIRAAVDRGVTFFDTAEVYGPYTNEDVVGEALELVRDQVTIATKFGWKILGHSRVAVTEAHYAHLLKEDLVAASQQVRIPVAPRRGGNVVKLHPRRNAGQS